MALAFVQASNGTTGSGTSLTYSATLNASTDLVVAAVLGGNLVDDCTGVTYNGVAMTLASKAMIPLGRYVYHWFLLSPATGSAHNFVASFNDSADFSSITLSEYSGASQSGQPDATNTNTGTTVTTLTTSVTVVAANSWTIMAAGATAGESNLDAGAGTTRRTTSNTADIYDSNGPLAAGSRSLIVVPDNGAPCNIATSMASYAPSIPVASSGFFSFMK